MYFHRIPALISGMLFILTISSFGQQSNTFYLLHQVPQSNLLNPAVQIQCKWFVGIPMISSLHTSLSNTAFSYNDMAGSEYWNLEGVLEQMHRVDLGANEEIIYPVSVGYKHKSYYFTFHVADRISMYQTIPKTAATLAVKGNSSYVGETAHLDALRTTGSYLREYALGASKVIDQYLTLGIKAKLLFGKANVSTGQSDLQFSTDENNFALLLEGLYTLNSSLPFTYDLDDDGNITGATLNEFSYTELMLNRRNPGLSVDLGAIYKWDDKITLSASLLDLGLVRWSTELNNLNAAGNFQYDELNRDGNAVSWDFLEEFVDSIRNSFDITVTQEPYITSLPAQLFLGGSYQIREKLSLGVVNRNLFLRRKIHSSLTLTATSELTEGILATLSWSYLNNSIKNIGAGFAFYGKGVQLHVVSDNILGFFYPFDSRTINLRMGASVMFGCPRDKKSRLINESYGQVPKGGNCSWTDRPGKRKRQMQRAAKRQN